MTFTEALNDSDGGREAAAALRSLIGEVVLWPGRKRGEVHAELRGELMGILDFANPARGGNPGEVRTKVEAAPPPRNQAHTKNLLNQYVSRVLFWPRCPSKTDINKINRLVFRFKSPATNHAWHVPAAISGKIARSAANGGASGMKMGTIAAPLRYYGFDLEAGAFKQAADSCDAPARSSRLRDSASTALQQSVHPLLDKGGDLFGII
ncbi:hypothetical protein [Chelativorans alearense]|uniref:hypothetical protein n=1 Tax=Chelativorans alearense TaxID=2681495 RepID=UPI001969D815|nr:hypothetical protein [Chelativorans alearense]